VICAPPAASSRTTARHAAQVHYHGQSSGPAVLYSLVRTLRPASIVECGSGFSTRLMRRAITEGGTGTRLSAIDPSPRVDVDRDADEHLAHRVEELDAAALTETLRARDILFIDSSHRVTTGGDVPFLFLEVLPRVQPGVYVHVHDIFLPYDYPQEWVVDRQWGWTEQYLVQAFLAFNPAFEIVWPSYYMFRHQGDEVARRLGAIARSAMAPASLWLRRTA
jgi:predicted O-methyltransferase YrrM